MDIEFVSLAVALVALGAVLWTIYSRKLRISAEFYLGKSEVNIRVKNLSTVDIPVSCWGVGFSKKEPDNTFGALVGDTLGTELFKEAYEIKTLEARLKFDAYIRQHGVLKSKRAFFLEALYEKLLLSTGKEVSRFFFLVTELDQNLTVKLPKELVIRLERELGSQKVGGCSNDY